MIAAIEEAAAEHLSERLSIKYDALRCDLEQFFNYKFKKLFQLLRLSQKLDIIGYLLKENEGYARNVLRDWGEVTPTQDFNKKLIKDVEQFFLLQIIRVHRKQLPYCTNGKLVGSTSHY